MRTELCDRFGIDYPIFVFTPSEKVAAAVSKAGGLGVLGCVRFNDADDLETVLCWMDENTDGKPYGVDVVMPAKVPTEGTASRHQQADSRRSTATSSAKPLPTLVFRRCRTTRLGRRVCSAGCTPWPGRTSR